MGSRQLKTFGAVCVVSLLWIWACTSADRPLPGDEVMGAFAFTAEAPTNTCPLASATNANFDFQGTFSRIRGSSEAWFTANGLSRSATFDGQAVVSTTSAARQFSECDGGVTLVETLEVSLLSHSQNSALGGCLPNPLDGGVFVDADAGIFAPGSTPQGFDAVRACGVLVDEVVPSVICAGGFPAPDNGCTLSYPISGVRQ